MKRYIKAVDITDDFVTQLRQAINYLFKYTCDKYGFDLSKIRIETIKLAENSVRVYFRYENNLLDISLKIPFDESVTLEENLWANWMIDGKSDYYPEMIKELIEHSAQFSTYRDNIISAYNSIVEILNNSELLEYSLQLSTHYKNRAIISGLDELNEFLESTVLRQGSFINFKVDPIRIKYYPNRFSITFEDPGNGLNSLIIKDSKHNNTIQISRWRLCDIGTSFAYGNKFNASAFENKVKIYEEDFKEYLSRLIHLNAYNKRIAEFIAKAEKAIPGIEIDYQSNYNNIISPEFKYQISYPSLFGSLDRQIDDIFIDDLDKVIKNLKATVARYKKSAK